MECGNNNSLLLGNLRLTLKSVASIIFSVSNKQLSVRKPQLPAPPLPNCLTHAAAGLVAAHHGKSSSAIRPSLEAQLICGGWRSHPLNLAKLFTFHNLPPYCLLLAFIQAKPNKINSENFFASASERKNNIA